MKRSAVRTSALDRGDADRVAFGRRIRCILLRRFVGLGFARFLVGLFLTLGHDMFLNNDVLCHLERHLNQSEPQSCRTRQDVAATENDSQTHGRRATRQLLRVVAGWG